MTKIIIHLNVLIVERNHFPVKSLFCCVLYNHFTEISPELRLGPYHFDDTCLKAVYVMCSTFPMIVISPQTPFVPV